MFSTISKVFVTLVILAASIFLVTHYDVKNIREIINNAGIYAPITFISICIIKPVLIFIPSLGLTVIAGLLFGPVYGTVYVIIGGAGSTLTGFYFARWLGRDFFERITKNRKMFSIIEEQMQNKGKKTIFLMRLFNIPWDIVSYWAGFAGVSFKDFYIVSIVALIPISFVYVYFGSSILSPSSPGFIISLSIILIMTAIPYIRKKIKAGKI